MSNRFDMIMYQRAMVMFYVLFFLHLVGLPLAIIISILTKTYELAIVNGIAFLFMFWLWWMLRKK